MKLKEFFIDILGCGKPTTVVLKSEFDELLADAKALRNTLALIAPSWLPADIRRQRRDAINEFDSKYLGDK